MAASYSQDLRDRVLAAYDRGMPTRQIAEVFAVSPAWARRVKQVRRERGQLSALRPGPRSPRRKIDLQRLRELVEQQPDATLRELARRLEVQCSEAAVCQALRRLKLTFKKRRSVRPSRTVRTSRRSGPTGGNASPASTPGV